MKKTLVTLTLFLAVVFQCLAQDTISGVVSRVDAPYFEQNVCDSRFALISEGETYYIMVDNYWPNPYLEDLVIHYDTIPVGNEIEVVGTIMEMVDGNGTSFKTVDVSKNLISTYQQIFGFFGFSEVSFHDPDPISTARFFHYTGFDCYFISINGELQTESPLVINGRTLVEDKRYLFIGDNSTWFDYDGNAFNVFELIDALPYDKEDLNVHGILTKENDLCLSLPYDGTHFLSLFDGEEHRYLTNKRRIKTNYINDAVFMEGDSVMVGGFEFVCHDIFGAPFKAFEFIQIQSYVEHLLIGGVGSAPIPYIGSGPPVPGLVMAFYSNSIDYYLRNPNDGDGFHGSYVVGDDTIQVTMQQLKATLVAGVFINNYLNQCYTAYINNVDFDEQEETLQCTLAVASNPFYWGNTLIVTTIDNDTCFLKPYLYTNTPPDHITIGDKTVCVGDSFTASGMVSYWYHNNEILEKVIEITDISNVTGLADETLTDIQINHTTSIDIIQIVSKQPIKTISACDYTGRILFIKHYDSEQATLSLKGYKGLVIIQIVLKNGQTLSRKVVL